MGNTATRNCPVCDSPNTSVVKYNIEISANTVTMERYICPICGTYELKAYKMSETLDCNHMVLRLLKDGVRKTTNIFRIVQWYFARKRI